MNGKGHSKRTAATPLRVPRLRAVGDTSPPGGSAASTAQPTIVVEHFLIAGRWYYMAPLSAIALLLLAACLGTMPPIPSVVYGVLGLAALLVSPRLVQMEQNHAGRPIVRRLPLMWCAVCLPMLALGLAVTLWAARGPPQGWLSALAVLSLIGAFAAMMLTGRQTSIISANSALWFPAVVQWDAFVGYAALLTAIVVGCFTAWYLLNMHREALAEQSREERERARAFEILIDYEETGQGWFWETDARGAITYVSAKIGETLCRPAATLIGRPLTELFVPGDREDEDLLAAHLDEGTPFRDIAVRAATPVSECWWSVSGRPLRDEDDAFLGFRGFGFDLTERRRSEENAARLAHFDSLTGLANRFQMSQKLERIIRAQHEEKRVCGVFLLDLDRFKQVNDTLGHPAGDALLKQVAERLERTVGKAGRVGRLGGDEFKVILPGLSDRVQLASIAARIIEHLSEPYVIDGQRVVIGASVGIAVSPHDGLSSEAMIRNADLALYAAKDGGRGRYHFYAADLHSDAEERRQLEHDLRDALANSGLELYYQPIIHTATERITGFEALLRWNHPALGPLSPAKFIPIAEDTGLIGPIGEWALRTACHDLARWPEEIRVAVNVSALQFANPALPSIVTSALAAAQIAPSRLELEITESVFMTDDEGIDAIFAALKNIGVRLALDDFGTGYSSLGYLKKAPFDKIKIDQSFVRGATVKGSRNGAIIASIVSLAEALGMETTAEGVETLDELDVVRLLGCSHIQGYIYEVPLSAIGASQRLKSGLTAIAHGPRTGAGRRQMRSRRVTVRFEGERYAGKIHNFSPVGALIEVQQPIPAGSTIELEISGGRTVVATVRWVEDGRMGLAFAEPLDIDTTARARSGDDAAANPRTSGLRKIA